MPKTKVKRSVASAANEAARQSPESWRRDRQLQELGFEGGYADYLTSTAWYRLKARYRKSDLPQDCQMCGSGDVELHHRTYERVGREELTDLIPLCKGCHSAAHSLHRRGLISNLDAEDLRSLVDHERAERYSEEARDQPRFEDVRSRQIALKQARSRSNRLRHLETEAYNCKVNVSDEIALIETAIQRIARKTTGGQDNAEMTIELRLAAVRTEAKEKGIDISQIDASIERRIKAAERRVRAKGSGM